MNKAILMVCVLFWGKGSLHGMTAAAEGEEGEIWVKKTSYGPCLLLSKMRSRGFGYTQPLTFRPKDSFPAQTEDGGYTVYTKPVADMRLPDGENRWVSVTALIEVLKSKPYGAPVEMGTLVGDVVSLDSKFSSALQRDLDQCKGQGEPSLLLDLLR